MAEHDLFSIGHSNIPIDRFIAMLGDAKVTAVADVRTTPFSRHFPWFSQKTLAAHLAGHGIGYLHYGDALGGRPQEPSLFREGVADYEAMARRPEFKAGADRLVGEAGHGLICMMCAEREPLDCHRCLLVARELAGRGLRVGHILHDGRTEPHAVTEERLLALDGEGVDLFSPGQAARLAAAYRHRADAVAYRIKSAGDIRPQGRAKASKRR